MGEIAEMILNGDIDEVTGEYIGKGQGFPRTLTRTKDNTWKKVPGYLNSQGFKPHTHPEILKAYGCKYPRRSPLRKASLQVLENFEQFKKWLDEYKNSNK